ncbi:MAG: hypothetical protein M0Q01_03830 [Syntrophales bacterium]|nr:hypothetical protein [Syntrophales bacterium]
MDENKKDILALTMDGTAINEFRIVDNTSYSQEIIDGARALYNLEKLQELKDREDLTEFYAEGKKQLISQWHAVQALTVHSDMFLVLLQVNIGEILNEVEPTFKKKSQYTSWLKNNFENRHVRYFQQAKQLADIGDFAKTNAPAGKNRILVLDSIRKVEKKKECEDLFDDHPFPDMTDDEDGHLLKQHIDAVITFHRFKNAGIEFATFDQAKLMASFNNEAIGVKSSDDVCDWLKQNPEEERVELLDRYIQDQMKYPSDHPYTPVPKASLDKVLADLINCYGTGNLENDSWIARQRELNIMESLLAAQSLIGQLIERMGTDSPAAEVIIETLAA